jgi:hypothetical protein
VKNYGAGLSLPDTVARIWPAFPIGVGLGLYATTALAGAVAFPLLLRSRPRPVRIASSLAAVHAVSMLTMPFCVSPYLAQGVPFVLLLLAALPEGVRERRIGLAALTLLGGFCALWWTGSRVFSVPLKPLSLAFSAFLLWVAVRARAGPAEPARDGPTEPAERTVR